MKMYARRYGACGKPRNTQLDTPSSQAAFFSNRCLAVLWTDKFAVFTPSLSLSPPPTDTEWQTDRQTDRQTPPPPASTRAHAWTSIHNTHPHTSARTHSHTCLHNTLNTHTHTHTHNTAHAYSTHIHTQHRALGVIEGQAVQSLWCATGLLRIVLSLHR